MNTNALLGLVSACGMMFVAVASVVYWRRKTRVAYRWLWVGTGLWTVAVALKIGCALLMNAAVLGFLGRQLPHWLFVVTGGLYVGIQSSLFEIGLTFVAVLIWKSLGRDADRAIGIGVGAGAFEAFLLGISSLIAVGIVLAGLPGAEQVGKTFDVVAATSPVFWLLAPVERVIAIICHAATRALVLLGVTHRKPWMVVGGFLLFTVLDGIAGAAHVSGIIGKISMWWIELAILPCALVSIPALRWCYGRWGQFVESEPEMGEPKESERDESAPYESDA